MSGTLIVDVETHDADLLYTMSPEEFVRLIGYKWWGVDEVCITTDLEEIREAIRGASGVVMHNGIAFDLPAIFGHRSNEWLELVDQGRVLDTFVHAPLVHPAPAVYIDRFGKQAIAESPAQMAKWFGLDEQAHQLGVEGKTHDLKALAAEFGGFEKIPVNDPRFREYLEGDVRASEAVAKALLKLGPLDDYAKREQKIAARMSVIASNGFRVNRERAEARVQELAERREAILQGLQENYDFPTEGASPWATNPGKKAILAALADHRITPKTRDWPKTPAWEDRDTKKAEAKQKIRDLQEKVSRWREEVADPNTKPRSVTAREGWILRAEQEIADLQKNPLPPAFGLSLSGDTLKELTKGTEAEDLGNALAELKGQRSLAQLALDSCHSDGFVHPSITMLQRSGRGSTTNPGLTVWTSKGPGAVEKAYFVPDLDDHALLEIDYSNADARIVAALSGDQVYMERFTEGVDGHMISAIAAWGEEMVATNPKHYRMTAKPFIHTWSYGGGASAMSKNTGVDIEYTTKFCKATEARYKVVAKWQAFVRRQALRGYVVNEWGRKMWVEKGREYTQAPALMGQSGTREIVCDALLRMPYNALRTVKAFVHDALIFSVPRDRFEACRDYLVGLMETEFKPNRGGQLIEFPVSAGPPGENWLEASHD